MTSTIIWIVVAIVVVLVAVAVVAALRKTTQRHKLDKRRTAAGEMRDQAAVQSASIEQRESQAAQADARAREARAEADARMAEAERMEESAGLHHDHAATERREYAEQMQQADEVDPDVDSAHTGPTGTAGPRDTAGDTASMPIPAAEQTRDPAVDPATGAAEDPATDQGAAAPRGRGGGSHKA